jgi:hypothetical protein
MYVTKSVFLGCQAGRKSRTGIPFLEKFQNGCLEVDLPTPDFIIYLRQFLRKTPQMSKKISKKQNNKTSANDPVDQPIEDIVFDLMGMNENKQLMNVSKKLHLILDTRSLIIKNLGYLPAAF